eukprot:scaffold1058_cov362-Prasinococcus_capsulatus_cf.AAC.6
MRRVGWPRARRWTSKVRRLLLHARTPHVEREAANSAHAKMDSRSTRQTPCANARRVTDTGAEMTGCADARMWTGLMGALQHTAQRVVVVRWGARTMRVELNAEATVDDLKRRLQALTNVKRSKITLAPDDEETASTEETMGLKLDSTRLKVSWQPRGLAPCAVALLTLAAGSCR